jgi:hypothetical protein
MALQFISENSTPAYTALTTDVVNSKIDGASLVGKLIYMTNNHSWYIINTDLTLSTYVLPMTIEGDVSIGAVSQGDAGVNAWLVDGSDVTQPVEGVGAAGTPSGGVISIQGVGSGTPVPVSGTVAVTGGLTDTQLRASAVPVSGTVNATTGGLTDTQLRASPVPVSGSVTATTGGLTDTQLRASAVPVSATALPLPSGAATSTIQTDGSQKAQIIQSVLASAENSSVATLNAGSTFTGTSVSSLGIAGIQVVLFANRDCMVYIQQSLDGNNWDISDSYLYYDSSNFGVTVQAVSSYLRVLVTNVTAFNATVFRLGTALCPIVEALPRSLNSLGYLKSGSFYEDIAYDDVPHAKRWEKIGYTPTMTTTESDIWSAAGVYSFPIVASQMEIVSSDNTQDIGTVIKGNAEGANQTVLCDAGGTDVTLNDADVDFTAATAVAVGDCLLIDPKGTSPEWGYITGVATNTLTFSGGLSKGGNCGTPRAYTVVDQSARNNAQVIEIDYLDSLFEEKIILMCLNGSTAVATKDASGNNLTDLYRINSFEMVAAGTGAAARNKPLGNLTLRGVSAGATYSYISAGYTRSRAFVYTVPARKTLYIKTLVFSYGYSAENTFHYARLYFRVGADRDESFKTPNIFYPYEEVICSNSSAFSQQPISIRIPEKTDMKASGVSTLSGIAGIVATGYVTGG